MPAQRRDDAEEVRHRKFDPNEGAKTRYCRKCKKKLPPDRWYICRGCEQTAGVLTDFTGEEIPLKGWKS